MWANILNFLQTVFAIRSFYRERPILKVSPIPMTDYHWFFRFPDEKRDGKIFERYGFLPYIRVKNKGRQPVQINAWYLLLFNNFDRKSIRLTPLMIPNCKVPPGPASGHRFYRVLGQADAYSPHSTRIDAFGETSGLAYYFLEVEKGRFYPRSKWGKIAGDVVVRGVGGHQGRGRFYFLEKSSEEASSIVKCLNIPDQF